MTERIRVKAPEESFSRERHYCQAGGCVEHTKGQKPFCRFHITQTAYAQKILADLERDEEDCY